MNTKRSRRVTIGNLLLVAGLLVILVPLGVTAYDTVAWWLQVRHAAEAPSPVLLTPVGEAVSALPVVTPPEPATPEPADAAAGRTEPDTPAPAERADLPLLQVDRSQGIPVYQVEIPRIGVKYLVGEGIDNPVLAKGPGHYPQTVLPGELGNAAIAGHRTIRGRPAFFYAINELEEGDEIKIGYGDRLLTFAVERSFLTSPYDLSVLDPTPYPSLTLTTCDPPGSDEKRLIVHARLVSVTNTP